MMTRLFRIILLGTCLSWSPASADDSTEVRIARLRELYNQGRVDAAYETADEWVAEEGETPEAWLWRGLLSRQRRQNEKALEDFRQALELRDNYAEVYVQLGDLLEQQGQWQEAIQSYQRVRDIRPEWAGACTRLGRVYRQNGLWAEAVEQYEQVLALDVSESQVQPMLELCRKAKEEVEEHGFVTAETLNQLALLPSGDADKPVGNGIKGLDMGSATSQPLSAIPVRIEFRLGKFALDDLSASGRDQLEQVAAALSSPEWQIRKIVIEGHTCSCGSRAYNHTLGLRRAETVRDYLIEQGIVPADSVSILSLGEEEPIAVSPHEELPPPRCELDPAHSRNRRVRIREEALEAEVPPIALVFSNPTSSPARVAWLYRSKNTGDLFRPLEEGTVLHSGDELRLFLTVKESAYVYIFHHSPQGEWLCLFPYSPIARQSRVENPIQAGREYMIPSITSIVLDDSPGREETFVYLNSQPVPEMEQWARDIPSDMEEKLAIYRQGIKGLWGIVSLEEDTEASPTVEEKDGIRWYTWLQFEHK